MTKKWDSQSSNNNFQVSNTQECTHMFSCKKKRKREKEKSYQLTMGFLKTWTWSAHNEMSSPHRSYWISELVPERHLVKSQFYPLTHGCGQGWRNSESAASRPLTISKFGGFIWSIQGAFWGINHMLGLWGVRGSSGHIKLWFSPPSQLVRIWHRWLKHGAEVSFVGLTPQWTCYLSTIPWPQSITSF